MPIPSPTPCAGHATEVERAACVICSTAAFLRDVADDAETEPLLVSDYEETCYPHAFHVHTKPVRKVTCSRCKREFIAFDALLYISRTWKRFGENRDCLKKEIDGMRAERDVLKKEVRSLKDKAKRAGATALVKRTDEIIRKGTAT